METRMKYSHTLAIRVYGAIQDMLFKTPNLEQGV